MMFGPQELFHNNVQLRLYSMNEASKSHNTRLLEFQIQHQLSLSPRPGLSATFYMKGKGNDPRLLNDTKTIYFGVRELVDVYIERLSKVTKSSPTPTSRDISTFFKNALAGNYDGLKSPFIDFFKAEASGILMCRKIRNTLKKSPANAQFIFMRDPSNGDHIMMKIELHMDNADTLLLSLNNLPPPPQGGQSHYPQLVLKNEFPLLIQACSDMAQLFHSTYGK